MRPSGPLPAAIAIVGEAPGAEEERVGQPFVGASGRFLNAILHEVGIFRSSCFVTNVCRVRPPDNDISLWFSDNKNCPQPGWIHKDGLWIHPNIATGLVELERELDVCKPRLIIALGNTALWALTQQFGISKWRGSRIVTPRCTVLPTFHPAACLRQSELRPIIKMDLRRAVNIFEGRQKPREYRFIHKPTFEQALTALIHFEKQPRIACDVETRKGRVDCIGFAWSAEDAICIPFLSNNRLQPFYWSVEQEAQIRHRIYRLFRRKSILWLGQNFLYDAQYLIEEGLGVPPTIFDTMIGHHAIYSNLRKSLDFLSSMYCHDHVYWKDELKEANEDEDDEKRWIYNCKDNAVTYEVAGEILLEQAKEAKRGRQ